MSESRFKIPQSVLDEINEFKSNDSSRFSIAQESIDLLNKSIERDKAAGKALAVEFGEGITFGMLGELAAAVESATSDKTYSEAKREYEDARIKFKKENPALAKFALPLEIIGSLPTGALVYKGLSKLGATAAEAGLTEGLFYGAASGDTFEDRVVGGAIGGLTGLTLGKVIDAAITPSSAGGLKTKADELADEAEAIDDQGQLRSIQEAEDAAIYREVDNPRYTAKPLREAQTAGELWDGLTGALKRFYDDKLTGVSDRLMRNVSGDVGGRYQLSDEAALRVIDKDLGNLQERLVPVIKIINEDERALGVLLDFGAGKLGKGFANSVRRLEKELADDLNAEHMASLKQYLAYSYRKNKILNKNVFGADFGDITYLHTRNRGLQKRLKDEGKTDDEIERLFDDPGFERRTRGSYLDEADGTMPNPLDYENPIVSDMRRIFKMERLSQIQRKFGVNIDDYKKLKQRRLAEERSFAVTPTGELAVDPIGLRRGLSEPVGPLTPTEFMEAFEQTLTKKGISAEGAAYARQQINDAIMGQGKAPHPLIQAANSLAYALTLAGPLSAVLNLADIPLVGAKYGGAAAREGMKAIPNPFTKIPSADLKKMGLSNQTFGEFVNILNDQASDSAGWMTKTAEKIRKSADFMMKGSGFAALDQVGKKGVMRGVLKSAMDDANAGNLADNWSFYFNKAELDILSNQLQKHGMDWTKYTGKGADLVEELMFAGLGQQQLISAAGRPAAWARHPNLRPLWALRGFVVKQQALALREVMGNLKAGRPEKAAEFLGRYAVYGAGGYAAINEGRQFIFGDGEASFSGAARGYGDAWASLLTANTLGLNDYQFGKIKQNGILLTFAEGLLPIAITRPLDIAGTAIGVADREYPVARLASEVPLVRDVGRVSRNVGERLGAQPLEDVGGMLTQKRLEEN
tara:strand:+ start:2657 stop:5419 length:2763 start_codon:yes stop_codon:yes gene_type:complete